MDRDRIREALTGPIASVHVPFRQDGAIDYDSLRRLLDFAIDGGSKTALLTYGNSLFSLLTDQEVADVTQAVVEQVAGRALVVAADRSWWTGQEVAFARFARETGADLLMVLPPHWAASWTVETLVDHYAAVAQEIPVMVVTNLFRTAQAQGLATMERLRDEVPGVVAVKDDVCGSFARKLGLLVHEKWAVIAGGQKQNHLNALPYGCDGYLSTYSSFAPHIAQRYWRGIQAQDWSAATAVIREFDMPYFDLLLPFPGGFDAAIHATFELFGLAQRWRRSPYHSASDEDLARLADFFTSKGLL